MASSPSSLSFCIRRRCFASPHAARHRVAHHTSEQPLGQRMEHWPCFRCTIVCYCAERFTPSHATHNTSETHSGLTSINTESTWLGSHFGTGGVGRCLRCTGIRGFPLHHAACHTSKYPSSISMPKILGFSGKWCYQTLFLAFDITSIR